MQSDDELRALVRVYVDDVLAGRRIVGRHERLAVERYQRDLDALARHERPDWRFNEALALKALRFACQFVRHTKGEWAGQRFVFCSRSAWIAFLLWQTFGWEAQRSDGLWVRRFDELLISTARKQGKSMIASIIALLMYVAQGEAAPEIYFGATQRAQAAICWKQAAGIVRKDPSLSKRLVISRASYNINKRDDIEAVFTALSRNDDEFDGLNPYCAVLDEVHAHPDSGLYDVLRSGMGARRAPLRVLVTTRGSNPMSFCGHHERAMINVLDGVYAEDSSLIYIASLDEEDDIADELMWAKANPNLGVTVSVDGIRKDLVAAQNDRGKMPEFRRKRMNLWTIGVKGWIPLAKWRACQRDVSDEEFHGRLACLAIDLSASNDFTAATAAALLDDGKIATRTHFWIPEEAVAKRRAESKVPIDVWVEAGFITVCPDEIVDQDMVKEWIREQRRRLRVAEVAFDPAQSWKLTGELTSEGVSGVVQFPQQWAPMHGAVKETEDAIFQHRLIHEANPVMEWMMRNVVVRENTTGLRRLDKAKSPDKIDGPVSMVMSVARLMLHTHKGQSATAKYGVLIV